MKFLKFAVFWFFSIVNGVVVPSADLLSTIKVIASNHKNGVDDKLHQEVTNVLSVPKMLRHPNISELRSGLGDLSTNAEKVVVQMAKLFGSQSIKLLHSKRPHKHALTKHKVMPFINMATSNVVPSSKTNSLGDVEDAPEENSYKVPSASIKNVTKCQYIHDIASGALQSEDMNSVVYADEREMFEAMKILLSVVKFTGCDSNSDPYGIYFDQDSDCECEHVIGRKGCDDCETCYDCECGDDRENCENCDDCDYYDDYGSYDDCNYYECYSDANGNVKFDAYGHLFNDLDSRNLTLPLYTNNGSNVLEWSSSSIVGNATTVYPAKLSSGSSGFVDSRVLLFAAAISLL